MYDFLFRNYNLSYKKKLLSVAMLIQTNMKVMQTAVIVFQLRIQIQNTN